MPEHGHSTRVAPTGAPEFPAYRHGKDAAVFAAGRARGAI
jgi:hypothetical protein